MGGRREGGRERGRERGRVGEREGEEGGRVQWAKVKTWKKLEEWGGGDDGQVLG